MTFLTNLRKKLNRRSLLAERRRILRKLETMPHDDPAHAFFRYRLRTIDTDLYIIRREEKHRR